MLLKFFSRTSEAMQALAAKEAAERAARVMTSKSASEAVWVMTNPPLSMRKAMEASLLKQRSSSAELISLMSSSMSCGSVDMGSADEWDGSGDLALALRDELLEQQPRDHVQGFEDAFAFVGAGG